MLNFELELNNVTYHVEQDGHAFDVKWHEWSEDRGSYTMYHTAYSHEELVKFLATKTN